LARRTKPQSHAAIDQHREWNIWKRENAPWWVEISKCVPQESFRDLDKAFSNFFRIQKDTSFRARITSAKPRKDGKPYGYPKFKKKGVHDSFRLTGAIHVFNNNIQLPRLGKIRTKESTAKFKGRILSATVSRKANRWFVSLSVKIEREIPIRNDSEVVGIDLGIKNFAVVYDGNNTKHIYAPKPLDKSFKKLQRASKKHSRKQRGSNNKWKSTMRLARLHRRICNQRKDFLHKTTTTLAKTKSVIVIEDLNIKDMVQNHHLAKNINDVSWGDFRRMLEYKTVWYDSKLVVINRFVPSSKTCSECGMVNNDLTLSDRTWVCMNCGAMHERDENAAKYIRYVGLETISTESSSGINACGDSSDSGTVLNWSTSYGSMKQEAST
jgi:putative transposase